MYRVLAIVILLCDIEFLTLESPKHEAVYIKEEAKLAKGQTNDDTLHQESTVVFNQMLLFVFPSSCRAFGCRFRRPSHAAPYDNNRNVK